MSTLFITSFGPKGWEEYARDCIATWDSLPGEIVFYGEGQRPQALPSPLGPGYRDLLADTELRRFLEGCRIFPLLQGVMMDGGYSYHFDAHKFARKIFAITNAVRDHPDYDIYVWLDADIKYHAVGEAPRVIGLGDEIRNMLDGNYVAYLGRPWWHHSECSFMAFNARDFSDIHKQFMGMMRDSYTKGLFLGCRGYHDCYVFDVCRELIRPPENNLSARGSGLNVMPQTVLAPYMTHLKGAAKRGGKSAE